MGIKVQNTHHLQIHAIPAFHDNYIWAIVDHTNHVCCLIDPGDTQVADTFLKQHQLQLDAILITHHHRDHTGGLLELKQTYQCHVYGPKNPSIKGIDDILKEKDTISLFNQTLEFIIYEVPGHTQDHIAYYSQHHTLGHLLFCGDTLFSGGCGRLFEGTPQQMLQSLTKLTQLPNETQVFCAHEYTLNNLEFAITCEPNNRVLQQRLKDIQDARHNHQITLPSTLEIEKETNPFLRCHQQALKNDLYQIQNQHFSNELEVFTYLRQLKDTF